MVRLVVRFGSRATRWDSGGGVSGGCGGIAIARVGFVHREKDSPGPRTPSKLLARTADQSSLSSMPGSWVVVVGALRAVKPHTALKRYKERRLFFFSRKKGYLNSFNNTRSHRSQMPLYFELGSPPAVAHSRNWT